MAQAQWSRGETEILVDIYENYPTLYAVKSAGYHNRNLKRSALEEVTKKLNTRLNKHFHVEEVKYKLTKLRSQFIEIMGKIKASKASGAEGDDVYEPTWFLFERLQFIAPHIIHRKGKSNWNIATASSSCAEHRPQELDTEPTESQMEFDDLKEEDILLPSVSPVYIESSTEDRTESPDPLRSDTATPTSSQSREPRKAIKRKMSVEADDVFKQARQTVQQLTAVPQNGPSNNIDELDHFFNYLKAETRNLKTAAQEYVKKNCFNVILEAKQKFP